MRVPGLQKKSGLAAALVFLLLSTLMFNPAESGAGLFDWFTPKKEGPKQTSPPPALQPARHPLETPPVPKTFTIAAIQPGPASSGTVTIAFTETCPAGVFRDKVKIFPPVQIDWGNSRFSGHSVTLKAPFRHDQEYQISLPEGTECEGKKYVKTQSVFKVPDLDPQIQFVGTDTVIERDSREMLHARVTNVDELRFQGMRVPALLAPQLVKEIREHSRTVSEPTAQTANGSSAPAPKKTVTDLPFEALSSSVLQKYQSLVAQPAVQAEFGSLLEPPASDSQVFFPGKLRNKAQEFSFPLSFRKDKEKGAVEMVRLSENRKNGAVSPVRVYRVTDLGLTYKLSKNSLLLWVTSLNTGKPVADVTVAVFLKNSDVIPLGKTDEKGLLFVKGSNRKARFSFAQNRKTDALPVPVREIEFIAAASQSDSTFIEVRESGDLKPEWVQQSTTVNTRTNLTKAQIFTERGIYRPGEKVFFKGVVREYRDGVIRPLTKSTRKVTIRNSKNEEIYSEDLQLSSFGTLNDSLEIKPFFPLGAYTLSMNSPGAAEPEAQPVSRAETEFADEEDDAGVPPPQRNQSEAYVTTTFEVQEFSAPRHFVEIGFRREKKKDDSYVNLDREVELLHCTITGKYYAGGPVKHGKVRWKASYRGTEFKQKEFRNFTFGSVIEEPIDLIESGESLLDEKGNVTVTFPLSPEVAAGLYSVEVSATVVDFDGKASGETSLYQEEPEYKVGLSVHDPFVRSGDMMVLKAIVVDKAGKKVQTGSLKVDVLREYYFWVRKRNEQGSIYWDERRAYRKDHSSSLTLKNSEAVFDFDFVTGGNYLIRMTYKGAGGKEYASSTVYNVEGYTYGYQDRQRNFERLSVSTERKEYLPGETVKVLISPQKPLSSVLMTVERKGILEYRNIGPVAGKKYIDIPVTDRHEPNIYVSFLGTVARKDFPVHTGQFDAKGPDFLFGVANVEIKKERQDLKLQISPDDPELKFEPGAEVKLRVSSQDKSGKGVETEMALCVVDESVLALTRFKTPVLYDLSRFVSPLAVFTGELRTELLKQTPYGFIRNEPLTGGDGAGGREVSVKLRKDFRPVAFYTPNLRTDKEGRAEVTFTLPDTMTNYRVYAVACDKGSRFASSERGLLSVKDFYLEPGLPRFFTKGDSFRFFVSAFNKTKSDGMAKLSLGRDELVKLSLPAASAPVRSQDRSLLQVSGEALHPGTARFLFLGELGEKRDSVEISLPVRSGHVLWNDVLFGAVKESTDVAYRLPDYLSGIQLRDLHPEDVKVMLTISGSPFIRMSKALRYLLHYPYGCVEQTSSAVIPLAALRALISEGRIPDITLGETDKFLKPGIDRLLSMQTASGGFGYWPGNQNPDMWGSVYAVSALTFAKQAGLEIPAERMTQALDYLLKTAKEQSSGDRTFRAYAAFLLAMNARADAALVRELYGEIARMPREGALMTLLAAKAAGTLPDGELVARARELIQKRTGNEAAALYRALYREPAIALLASIMLLKDEAVSGRLAADLLGGMGREGMWTSTSDTGWSLIALGAYFRETSAGTAPVTVTIAQEGALPLTVTLSPKEFKTYQLDSAAFLRKPAVRIAAQPASALTYMLGLTFPRTDLAKQGYAKGFTIHKTIENMDGSKEIRVGDIVKVKIDVQAEPGYRHSYLVLDDPLPAGLVAINSAIKTEEKVLPKTSSDSDSYWDVWDQETGRYRFTPNHFEMRDERVLAFKDWAWQGGYQYSYFARAVCEGTFVMPSTKVQLMYEPDVAAFTPMGKVTILERREGK